jgi:hypothetical protein
MSSNYKLNDNAIVFIIQRITTSSIMQQSEIKGDTSCQISDDAAKKYKFNPTLLRQYVTSSKVLNIKTIFNGHLVNSTEIKNCKLETI